MSYEYFDTLDGEAKSRYLQKIKAIKLKECPYRLPADVWVNAPADWPNVEYPDIYEYLMNTPGAFSRKQIKSRKGLDGYNHFQSGWVDTVYLHKIDKHVSLMSANVKHSQRMNELPLRPWFAASNDGTIISAHCNCMAGLGEACSHIGALMFKVEAAVRLGYTTSACTDQPCIWNNDFVKSVEGEPLRDIQFYRKKELNKRHAYQFADASEQEKGTLLDQLSSLEPQEQPVCLSLFAGNSSIFHFKENLPAEPRIPRPLREYFSVDGSGVDAKIEELSSIKLNEQDRDFVEKSTRGQRNSLAWRELRIGRITASVAHEVLHTNMNNPSKTVVRKICCEPKPLNVPSVLWGQDNEDVALKDYERQLKASHKNVSIEKSGLKLDAEFHFLGASADAVGYCDCHGSFLIEVKCPFKHKDTATIEECCKDKTFCLDDNQVLKSDHKYMTQVQMQMHVYKVHYCHFVVWGPNFCKANIITYDYNFFQSVNHLVDFYHKIICKELVTRSLENETASKNQQEVAPVYCYCQKPCDDIEPMVGCDNPSCQYQWIHFQCARPKLKRPPRGAWYCKDCKKKKRSETK